VKFYLSDDEDGRALLDAIRSSLGRELTTATVQDSDWENNWRQYYEPIEIGEKLVVVPEWLEAPEDGRVPLRLDPGLIFGTGSHATTKMCLAALERCAAPGKTVLDLGCGSGILAIGALLLGCECAAGCDIDPKAPEVAEANAALNGIGKDRFAVYAGDVLTDAGMRKLLGGGYDIVTANILADVLTALTPEVVKHMKHGALYISSGILDVKEKDVTDACTAQGLEIVEVTRQGEWVSITARRN
jgi:ribosomal protein L11 methyltransferase